MSEIASYRAGYNNARLMGVLYAIIGGLVVLLFGGAIAFDDLSDVSGRREWTFGLVIGFAVIAPILPMFLTGAVHEWRLFRDRLAISERPTLPLLLARRQTDVSFANLRVVRTTDGLMGIRHLELEDDLGRRFRLGPKVEGSAGKWLVDNAAFDAFVAQLRDAVEAARGGPVKAEPLPVFWATALGVAVIALFLLVPVGTMIAALWIFVSRGNFEGLAVAFASFLLSAGVYGWLKKSWAAFKARRGR